MFADKSYVIMHQALKASVSEGISPKAPEQHPVMVSNIRLNHKMSSIRPCIENVFGVVKRQFGHTKVSYK